MMKQSFEAGKSGAAGKMYFLSGVFYGAEGILRSDITVFLGGGNRQRTLSLRECAFYVEPHSHKIRFSASFAPAKLTRAEEAGWMRQRSLLGQKKDIQRMHASRPPLVFAYSKCVSLTGIF